MKMNPRSRRTGLMPGSYSGANSSYSYYPTYYSTPFFSSGYSGGYSSYYSRGSSYSSGSTAPSSYSAGNDCSRLAREAVRDLQASRTRYRGSKTDSELTLGETGFLCGLIHTQSLMLEEWRFCFYHQSQHVVNNVNSIQGLRSKSVEPSLAKEASVTRELFKDREFTPAREEVMMSSIMHWGLRP